MVLERIELLIPLPLLPIEPGLKPAQPVGPKSEHAQPSIFGASLVGEHAGMEKDAEVSAHGRWGDACRIGQLAGTQRPTAEELDHLATRGVREGAEDSADIHSHQNNS